MSPRQPSGRRKFDVMWMIALPVFLFVGTLTTHGKYSVSGDEPHYLMITQSIVSDLDLDVGNNYAANDGRLFGHDQLVMGPHAMLDRAGRTESVHDIGLPVLLIPEYLLARAVAPLVPDSLLTKMRMTRGLFAYSLISLSVIGVTAWSAALLGSALMQFSGNRLAAVLVAALTMSPPILGHAFLVFPEVVALFVTCLVVWLCLDDGQVRALAPAVALVLGLLPWCHRKYSFYVFGLAFVVLWIRRDWFVRDASRRYQLTLMALFLLPQIAFHLWTIERWGGLGGPQMLSTVPFSFASMREGILGLWLDRQSGVLSYGLLYWLAPAAWTLTWRRTWPFAVPALMLYLPMAAYVNWDAGFSPAGRYLVPVLPLLAVPMSVAIRSVKMRWVALGLLVPQAAIDVLVWRNPKMLWPSGAPQTALEELGPFGRAYETLLPPIQMSHVAAAAVPIVAIATMATAAIVALSWRDKGFNEAAPEGPGPPARSAAMGWQEPTRGPWGWGPRE